MICYVHRDDRFARHLNALRERGGTALSAVKKAEEIIARVLRKGRENSLNVSRLTRRGESRIKAGLKYDLGNGYRLVCSRKGHHLLLLYIGTHDECSRWLERNKGVLCEMDNDLGSSETVRDTRSIFTTSEEIDPSVEYEEELMRRIDDRMLRTIFCGLVRK